MSAAEVDMEPGEGRAPVLEPGLKPAALYMGECQFLGDVCKSEPCLSSFDDWVDGIECSGAFDEHQQVVLIAIRAW